MSGTKFHPVFSKVQRVFPACLVELSNIPPNRTKSISWHILTCFTPHLGVIPAFLAVGFSKVINGVSVKSRTDENASLFIPHDADSFYLYGKIPNNRANK